eukprot:TRINITY_DN62695_c0_g1_i1.p1 TRINITY_DN62695_c0_g1~~TRINITY_DN62695_c0_g1_i1.p1  ORF type:complete len:857 (+),score=192.28 TRINITY_DN62695_c0_g1_i1:42-2612(+)
MGGFLASSRREIVGAENDASNSGSASSSSAGQAASADAATAAAAGSCEGQLMLVAPLLARGQFEAVQTLLASVLTRLDSRPLFDQELAPLGAALLDVLVALPLLEARRELQRALGFTASGLAALTTGKVRAPEFEGQYRRCRSFLRQAVALAAALWTRGSALACQEIDRNRFLLRFSADLACREPSLQPALASLVAACCDGALIAVGAVGDFWNSRYFASHLEGVVAVFAARRPPKPVLQLPPFLRPASEVQQPHASTAAADAAIARSLVAGSQRLALDPRLAERLLEFTEAWREQVGDYATRAVSAAWLTAVGDTLLMQAEGTPRITGAACLGAFFLPQNENAQVGVLDQRTRAVAGALIPYLGAAIANEAAAEADRGGKTHESILALRAFVARRLVACDQALESLGASHLCSDAAALLNQHVWEAILHPASLQLPGAQLAQRRRSAACRLLPEVAEALSKCLSMLEPSQQVELVMRPLEAASAAWTSNWAALGAGERLEPTRHWFIRAVFLLVSTVLRHADHKEVGAEALLMGVRALAHLEAFREDSQEYRALLLVLAERGAESPDFVAGLFDTLRSVCEPLDTNQAEAMGSAAAETALFRVHFLLGVLASGTLIKAEGFFEAVWPVIIARVLAAGDAREATDASVQLSLRAQALACICLDEAGATEALPRERIRLYLAAVLGSMGARTSPGEEASALLVRAVACAARQAAEACDQEHNFDAKVVAEARSFQRWLLRSLGDVVLRYLAEGRHAAAAAVFDALCAAAASLTPDFLPEPFYTDSRLRSILAAHAPLRETWARSLVSSFAEWPRILLVSELLRDFPGTAAASTGIVAAAERARRRNLGEGSTRRSAL